MDNRCVCCGQLIPEGRMVCPDCEEKYMQVQNRPVPNTEEQTDFLSSYSLPARLRKKKVKNTC